MTYTPGPWKAVEGWDKIIRIHSDTCTGIAQIGTGKGDKDDASLIAAAPDMYEALKGIYNALIHRVGGLPDSSFTDAYFAIKAAIDKAEDKH
jgi:hypothetical protein